MSLWVCDPHRGGCTTAYSVGAPRCPHCGKTAAYELGDEQRRDVRDIHAEQPNEQPASAEADAAPVGPSARSARASRPRKARGQP